MQNLKNSILVVISLFIIIFIFQNCESNTFSTLKSTQLENGESSYNENSSKIDTEVNLEILDNSDVSNLDKLEYIESVLRENSGNKKCQTKDDCIVKGLGHRSCGGFSLYMIVSKQDTDLALLDKLTYNHVKISKELSEAQQLIGTCVYFPLPENVICNTSSICERKDFTNLKEFL